MIDTIITGLVLMSVSGLTFIAYNHPDDFNKIYNVLYFVSFLIFFCILSWNFGLTYAHLNLLNLIPNDKVDIAHKTIEDLKINSWVTILSFAAFIVYINILSFLPQILKNRNNEKQK